MFNPEDAIDQDCLVLGCREINFDGEEVVAHGVHIPVDVFAEALFLITTEPNTVRYNELIQLGAVEYFKHFANLPEQFVAEKKNAITEALAYATWLK